jgi:predicted RNA-binding Zn ribbon-like protein
VNTGTPEDDRLSDLDALRELLTIGQHMSGRVGRQDLDAMRELRDDLRAIFEAVAADDECDAVERLNSLLIQHPIHPQVSGHDGHRWHLHITESGSIPDRYAAGAAMGLAVLVSADGVDRLAVCEASECRNVFFDTSSNRNRHYCSDRCATRGETAAQLGLSQTDGLGQ